MIAPWLTPMYCSRVSLAAEVSITGPAVNGPPPSGSSSNAALVASPLGWTSARPRYMNSTNPCCIRSTIFSKFDMSDRAEITVGRSCSAKPSQSIAQKIVFELSASCACPVSCFWVPSRPWP